MLNTSGDTVYEYQVKSEQIETDAGYQGNATSVDDLDPEIQDAIFDAYKASDHFLGGSSAEIERSEPLELDEDDRWIAVEIEGARVLVGISGPDTYESMDGKGFFGGMLVAFGFFGLLVTFMARFDQ